VSESVALSSRTAITALDDGVNFWCFYTTDKNEVYRLRVDAKGAVTQPQKVPLDQTPVLRSSLAGVLTRDLAPAKIVLFYLIRHHSHVDLVATTLKSTTSEAADSWDVSPSVVSQSSARYPRESEERGDVDRI
jgi:hypothetical protein